MMHPDLIPNEVMYLNDFITLIMQCLLQLYACEYLHRTRNETELKVC